MRLLPLLLIATAAAQSNPTVQRSNTAEGLRGASVVTRTIAWVSGTHGTYLRTTDGGQSWSSAQVPDAANLDFRAVVAFSADEAFLMSAGPGEQSRIYHTTDAGQHWQLQFTNSNGKGFFDSMVFWDRTHGVVLGDPIPDDSGKLKFELLRTDDGEHWSHVPSAQLPPAVEGEGAFAASNTCLAIVPPTWGQPPSRAPARDSNLWFATGGAVARVFHSPDRGRAWEVFNTPVVHGQDSTGIFSIAFRDPLHGVIAGGDYKHPDADGSNLAFTEDGGKTWTLSPIHPLAYFSAAAYDRKVSAKPITTPEPPQRIFLVGHDFVFDYRPPLNPVRLNAGKKLHVEFNAVAPFPDGGALLVGPKGVIATIP